MEARERPRERIVLKPTENQIRDYLLGLLPAERAEQLEEQLLRDEDFVEQLSLIEDELIEDYARGVLNRREREQFEKQFSSIPRRRRKLMMVRELRKYSSKAGPVIIPDPAPRPRPWYQSILTPQWRALAAAVLLLVVGIGAWLITRPSDVEKGLLALNEAYQTQRPVEARVTGLEYAPYSVTRGPVTTNSRAVDRSAALLHSAVSEDSSAEALHALGRFYLLQKDFDKAVAQFEEALKKAPEDPQLHSDFGAALLEKGKLERTQDQSGRSETTLASSLEHLNRALQLSDSLLDARFNRALLYEQMKLMPQALEDWQKYVSLDPNSKWGEEARKKIEEIRKQEQKVSSRNTNLFDEFVQARTEGNEEKAWQVFTNAHLRNGNAITNKLIDNYLDAVTNGRAKDAEESLQALTQLANFSTDKHHDRFTADLAHVYRSATPTQIKTLEQARRDAASGYQSFSQAKFDSAIESYRSARDLFEQVGNRPEALLAHFWRGYCLMQLGNELKESLTIFNDVDAQSETLHYKWLLSLVQIGLANVYGRRAEYSKAFEQVKAAYNTSTETDDTNGALRSLNLLSTNYRNVGNYRQSLQAAQKGLELGAEISADASQIIGFYATSAWSLNSLGHYDAALEFEKQALRFAYNPLTSSRYRVQMGHMQGTLRNYEEAIQNIRQGIEINQDVGEEKSRLETAAYGHLFLGRIYRESGRFSEALAALNEVMRFYQQDENQLRILHEARKEQLLTHIAQGEINSARQELAQVIDNYEKQREKILEDSNRSRFFAKEQGIYDIAIDFAYTNLASPRQAFDYSENSRARSLLDTGAQNWRVSDEEGVPDLHFSGVLKPMPVEEVQRNLPSRAQLLQFAVLKEKLITWYLTTERYESTTVTISSDQLVEKVDRLLNLVSRLPNDDDHKQMLKVAAELYDVLIAPVAQFLDPQKQLCIVGDKVLNLLPFNVLFSAASQKYLVEDFALNYASSANMFVRDTKLAQEKASTAEKLLGVANPSFNRRAFPDLEDLPTASREVNETREFYDPGSVVLNGRDARKASVLSTLRQADVVHLATHYLPEPNAPMLSRLLLASDAQRSGSDGSSDGVLHAYEIYKLKPLRSKLAILSACRTGVEENLDGEGAIGLARPFKAASVPLVLASLWPVDSQATTELMVNFHRLRRRERHSSAEALRAAQLQMLRHSNPSYHRPYYWASFALIGGYSSY